MTADRLSRSDDKEDVESLRQIIGAARDVLSGVRNKLGQEEQHKIDVVLEATKSASLNSPVASPRSASKCLELLEPFRRSSISAHRYLGEISDVSFFNSVKGLLQNDSSGARLESYERENADLNSSLDSTVESS